MININNICSYIKSLFAKSNLILVKEDNVLKRIKLRIRSDRHSIVDTAEKLEQFFLKHCPELDTGIGFYELLVNAGEHGNNFDPTKRVAITVAFETNCARIYIEDQGKGFNWQEKLREPAPYDSFDERGRGICLAKIFCDDLIYNEKGNKVCLVKKRNIFYKDKGPL